MRLRPRRATTWLPSKGGAPVQRRGIGLRGLHLPTFRRRRGASWAPAQGPKTKTRRRLSLKDLRLPIPADMAIALAIAVLVGGLSFLYIHQGTMLRALTADREALQENLTELEEINHTLRLEIAEAFSLPRVSKYATEHLGMIQPSTTRYVRVPPSSDE